MGTFFLADMFSVVYFLVGGVVNSERRHGSTISEEESLRLLASVHGFNLASILECDNPGQIPPLCSTSVFADTSYFPPDQMLRELHFPNVRSSITGLQTGTFGLLCSSPAEEQEPREQGKTVGKAFYGFIEAIANSTQTSGTRRMLPSSYFEKSLTYRAHIEKLPASLGGEKGTPNGGCQQNGAFTAWLPTDVCQGDKGFPDTGGSKSLSELLGLHLRKDDEQVKFRELWFAGQIAKTTIRALGSCTKTAANWLLGATISSSSTGARGVPQNFESLGQPPTSDEMKMIGVHVRRGDACFRWAAKGDSKLDNNNRPCYKLDVYIQEARRFKDAYGVATVAVATDSDSVIQELVQYTSEFEFMYIPFNRSLVGGPDMQNMGIDNKDNAGWKNFIENRQLSDDTKALVLASAVAEIQLLAQAQYFVGTSLATMSRLAWLGQIGRLGYMPPFSFLDEPIMGCPTSIFMTSC